MPKKTNMTKKLTTEEFIKRAREVHGDKYDYSKVEYKTAHDKITIICPIHGEFEQSPDKHLRRRGCPECAQIMRSNKQRKTAEKFIEEARAVHGDEYDYSKVKYIKNSIKVKIICPKHGEFEQSPNKHLLGQGCPFCKRSKLEMEVEKLLKDNAFEFTGQMKFDWLGSKSLDFYIPSLNVAIECQGRQHFEPVKAFGGEDEYKRIVERDREKYNLCKVNGVKLLYYSHKSIFGKHELKHNVITTRKLLLEEIKS